MKKHTIWMISATAVLLLAVLLCAASDFPTSKPEPPQPSYGQGSPLSLSPTGNVPGTLSENTPGTPEENASENTPETLPESAPENVSKNTTGTLIENAPETASETLIENTPEMVSAAYVYIHPEGNTVSSRIQPPEGFTRVDAAGFGTFLREYPLLEDGAPVLLHDGTKKWNQNAHVAVLDMALVQGDLQQCADSCMRLYAEYFYQTGSYDKIAFHLVNGFLLDFDTWRKGGRVSVNGNKTEWVMNAAPSDSPETFEKYLRFVFAYASTLSMDKESEPVELAQIRAGDFFLKGGSPGHVVMVLDVCENENGEKAFLLGQGYMPAQQFHVLKNPAHEENPWYYVSEVVYPFMTPEYTFGEGSFQRPQYDKQ